MEDQKQFSNESDSDNRDLIKAMRFSQLDDESAAKLYEERFRQIESDMMKKMQNKKNYQKKGLGNPRSSSSLGTYGTPSHQAAAILQQGQSPSANFQNTQSLFSAKNQTLRSQVLSKFQGAATQQGYMYQSTTLNGGSRLPTEENNSQDTQPTTAAAGSGSGGNSGITNFVPQKGKFKSQRSCEFLVINQSPAHNRQLEENNNGVGGGLFLNQGFLSPQQHTKNQGQKAKNENIQNNSAVVALSSQVNSYQKQNKAAAATNQTQSTQQSQINSSQPPQRPFLSPPSKRSHQSNLKIGQSGNTSQPGISRFEMSPSGRPSSHIHMTSQGFYSPQASYHHHHSAHIKFTQGTQTATNRRSQNDGEVQKLIDRKKVDKNVNASSAFALNKFNNGSQTTTATATIVASSEQLNSNNQLFSSQISNNQTINSPNSYLIQAQNLRSSLGFQGNSSSQLQQSSNFNQYQVQAKLNGNSSTKKKDGSVANAINNKRSELEELDLRIQTIEREIERDNELTQNYTKKQSTQIGTPQVYKNNQKVSNKQSNTPHAQQPAEIQVYQLNSNNQGLLDKVQPSTVTHKGSTNLYQNKYFNPNYENQNQRYQQNQQYEVNVEGSPLNLKTNNQSTKNQNKTQQDFNKLNIPKSDHIMNSHENSSYNNTPRSVNPIHDFRPLNKYQKKQVNFKSDNRMATSESYEERIFKLSPTSNAFQKSLLSPQNQDLNGNNNGNSQNELNLKSQINNQIQMQISSSSSSRKNTQIHSNPPSQQRIQTQSNTVVQYSINNLKNQNNNLKFQKKLNQTVQQNQNSENSNSNSNYQYQNSRMATEEGADPEMSEFEYLEKIVNAKNTETSSVNDDTSIRNETQFQLQRVPSANSTKKNTISQQNLKQQSAIILKGKDNSKVTPIKNSYGQRNAAFSNRESTSIQQNQQSSHFIYVEQSSPQTIPMNSSKQAKGQNYLSLRQSDIIPSNSSNNKTSKSQQKSDSGYITSFQINSTNQSKKLSLKTLENNFVNVNRDNTDQQSKYSNNSNNAQNSSSVSQSLSPSPVPMYNLYSQQNQAALSSNNKSNNKNPNSEKQMQKKMNRSSEVLSKNSQNNTLNVNNANQNTNVTRTPSVSSNNISTLSNNTAPLIQISSSATSLNKGQLQMSNKQKNNPPVMMTHTLDTFKNKKDFKIKNPAAEPVSKIINQDQGQPQIRVEAPKKSNFKQAHFQDDKEEQQLEQMSKNLHKKLNLLLETANQCNENIKSYRISHNV